jgi:SPP1 gp7 family putative phage head morphogenesis protein
VETNVSLIQNIPEQSLRNIESKLRAGIEQGVSAKELQKRTLEEIVTKRLEDLTKDELKKAKNRAKLIARDQTNKFLGNLNELRQTSLGVEEYTWSTSKDERVRPTHAANDGKVFKWSDPPPTGIPGSEINCRCTALPVLEDFK